MAKVEDSEQPNVKVSGERIPPELQLAVISHLTPEDESDYASIILSRSSCRCCLFVSRLFRTAVLAILFEHVIIGKYANEDQDTDSLFYAAILAGDEHARSLAHKVRKCTLMGREPGTPENRYVEHNIGVSFDNVDGIKYMPNIVSLALVNIAIDTKTFDLILDYYKDLISLDITAGKCPWDVGKKFYLLSNLRKITQLTIKCNDLQPRLQELMLCNDFSWNLIKMDIGSIGGINSSRALRNRGMYSCLRDVTFSWLRQSDVSSLFQFLNSTPTITSFRLMSIGTDQDDERHIPSHLLVTGSIPFLNTVQCPSNWLNSFVPGRPIEVVNTICCAHHSEGPHNHRSESWVPLLTALPESYSCLRDSTARIQRLTIPTFDYVEQLCISGNLHAPEVAVDHLTLFDFFSYLKSKGRETSSSTLDLSGAPIRDSMIKPLMGPLSSTVRRLELCVQGTTFNLPLQFSTVRLLSSIAFPNATRIYMGRSWADWRRIPHTPKFFRQPIWKPVLYMPVDSRRTTTQLRQTVGGQGWYWHSVKDVGGFYAKYRSPILM